MKRSIPSGCRVLGCCRCLHRGTFPGAVLPYLARDAQSGLLYRDGFASGSTVRGWRIQRKLSVIAWISYSQKNTSLDHHPRLPAAGKHYRSASTIGARSSSPSPATRFSRNRKSTRPLLDAWDHSFPCERGTVAIAFGGPCGDSC